MNILRRLLGYPADDPACFSRSFPPYKPVPLDPDPTVCLGCQEGMKTEPDRSGAPVHVSDDRRHWFPCRAAKP